MERARDPPLPLLSLSLVHKVPQAKPTWKQRSGVSLTESTQAGLQDRGQVGWGGVGCPAEGAFILTLPLRTETSERRGGLPRATALHARAGKRTAQGEASALSSPSLEPTCSHGLG